MTLYRRDGIVQLKEQLQSLGATQVLTYDELNDKSLRDKVNAWLDGKVNVEMKFLNFYLTPATGNTLGS
jgi:hypothetical protein